MKICVYCGSNHGQNPAYEQIAKSMGAALAAGGHSLIYGGGGIGLMGAVANGAIQSGGEVIGVMPKALAELELAHPSLAELIVVESMHERKANMADLSDAFVAMPGGLGTFEELFEVWTWTQLGFHHKAIALLNINGYYDHLIAFLDHSVNEGFVKPIHRDMLIVEDDPETLIARLADANIPTETKWIDREKI